MDIPAEAAPPSEAPPAKRPRHFYTDEEYTVAASMVVGGGLTMRQASTKMGMPMATIQGAVARVHAGLPAPPSNKGGSHCHILTPMVKENLVEIADQHPMWTLEQVGIVGRAAPAWVHVLFADPC